MEIGKRKMKIAVIGAGISGLSFAKYCKIYRKDWEVKVFESLSSHGGIAKVKMIDGIPFSYGWRALF